MYDSTQDTLAHQTLVKQFLYEFAAALMKRADGHDQSKLQEPEKSMYDQWKPVLSELSFGSDAYKKALAQMGVGLKHHYEANRHHPEHFSNGIDGMNLADVVEMFCDWLAVAMAKKSYIPFEVLRAKYDLSAQLAQILFNSTLSGHE